MCKQCQINGHTSDCLTFTIDIRQPFECLCAPSADSLNIATSDVVTGLLKYNSNLTKYLAKYQTNPQNIQKQQQRQIQIDSDHKPLDPNKSIIDIYNLKVLPPENRTKDKQQQQSQQNSHNNNNNNNNNRVDVEQQTSPRNDDNKNKNKNKPKYPAGSNQDKIQKHLKQVKLGSRYLSNTGFKKYFGRECFENYGRENTTGVADGIVYNNYLKTFNIAPHCGTNMPITQQTDKRALIGGDTKNYNKQLPVPETHYGNKQDREAAEGYHKKPLSQMQQVIKQSDHRRQQKEKYTVKLSPPQESINTQTAQYHFLNPNKPAISAANIPVGKNEYQQNEVVQRSLRKQMGEAKNKQRQNVQSNKQIVNKNEQEKYKVTEKRTNITNITNYNNQYTNNQNQPIRSNNRGSYGYAQRDNEGSQKYIDKNQQFEEWGDQQNDNSLRYRQKREIMSQCYNVNQISHQIQKYRKPACGLCTSRRYSKCCCGS